MEYLCFVAGGSVQSFYRCLKKNMQRAGFALQDKHDKKWVNNLINRFSTSLCQLKMCNRTVHSSVWGIHVYVKWSSIFVCYSMLPRFCLGNVFCKGEKKLFAAYMVCMAIYLRLTTLPAKLWVKFMYTTRPKLFSFMIKKDIILKLYAFMLKYTWRLRE